MPDPEPLFSKDDGNSALDNQQCRLAAEIDTYDSNAVIAASLDELCDYFENKYRARSSEEKTRSLEPSLRAGAGIRFSRSAL
jgi:hypothetical protein